MAVASQKLDASAAALIEQERLLNLFSNRVALKKAYSELRYSERALKTQLDEANARAQSLDAKLGYLEGLLTDEQTALGTMLFYHLKGLWRRCNGHLRTSRDQMATRISGRRAVERIEQWRLEHADHLASVDQQLVAEKANILSTRRLLRDLEAQILKARYPWHWFRRRRIRREQRSVTEELRAQVALHDDTLAKAREARVQRPPNDQLMTVSDQRTINLHLLALAQFMTRHFEKTGDLAEKSRQAFHQGVGTIEYGDDRYCRGVMLQIDQSFEWFCGFTQKPEFSAAMRGQVKWLAANATYAYGDSTIPEPFRVDPLTMIDKSDHDRFTPIGDVLQQDQWSVAGVLLSRH